MDGWIVWLVRGSWAMVKKYQQRSGSRGATGRIISIHNPPTQCNGGIFVMQTLDEDHVLIAVGQAGANFGALRYTMDKTKAKFGDILGEVPR